VIVALGIQHAVHMQHTVICVWSVRFYNIYQHFSQTARFSKTNALNIKLVLYSCYCAS